jgi:hypothetical protein
MRSMQIVEMSNRAATRQARKSPKTEAERAMRPAWPEWRALSCSAQMALVPRL